MRDIGRGYVALCSYNCKEAINILSQLPTHHYNTGWVLSQIGRAHFELAEYTQVRADTDVLIDLKICIYFKLSSCLFRAFYVSLQDEYDV